MEKAYLKREGNRLTIISSDIICAVFALFIGVLEGPFVPMFIFLFLAHSYLRSKKEAGIVIGVILFSCLVKNVLDVYFYTLGFAFFFMLVYLAKVWNRNLYVWIPILVALVVVPYTFRDRGVYPLWYVIPLIALLLGQEMVSNYSWITKSYALSQTMLASLILVVALFLGQLMPLWDYSILLVGLLICAFMSSLPIVALYTFLFYMLMSIQNPVWFCIPLIVSIFKDKKMMAVLILSLFGVTYAYDILTSLYFVLAIIFVLFPWKFPKGIEVVEEQGYQIRLPKENLLRRQMQNYASIFTSLSEYYASVHETESQLLEQMANALQYQAEEIQKANLKGHDEVRLKRALEGYQFDVDMLKIDEYREGCIRIRMAISNIRRGEVHMTLLPLMEALLQRKLEVAELTRRQFVQGFTIELKDHTPFRIEVCGDSKANAYTSSGDTYSIFKFRQSLVCMISDGMGNGEKAAQSSRLIASIFQKMMISGLAQDSAIRCINQLVQSDTYATLDVLCFNQAKGVAYISKSAACPTYLLREHKLYEISGSSLPVGIVSQIQPDCFEIDLKHEDEFIMISDGVELHEIYTWIQERKGLTIKEDMQTFISILTDRSREDDSTVIIAKVNEIMG